jgi:hypothetical protein
MIVSRGSAESDQLSSAGYFNKSSGTDQECKSANSRTQPGEEE